METLFVDYFDIPIFIISYNRLSELKKIIFRLESDGYKNIHVIDNASNDEELLQYLKKSPHTVHFLDKNWGPDVLWQSHLFDDIILHQYYVLTDPDVIPVEECPPDYVQYFYEVLQAYPKKTKVGFALKLDDIPEDYRYKYDIWRFESFYWEKRIQGSKSVLYDAPLDTTFALYRPGALSGRQDGDSFFSAIRTGAPYIARHLGWYVTEKEIGSSDTSYYADPKAANTSHNEKQMMNFRYATAVNLLQNANMKETAYLVNGRIERRNLFRVCTLFVKFLIKRILKQFNHS